MPRTRDFPSPEMKRITISVLNASLGLLCAASVSAQDAPAPLRRFSPSPSPSASAAKPTQTPVPKPAETAKPRPAPTSTPATPAPPSPAPTPAESSAPETPAPAPQPTSPPSTPEQRREARPFPKITPSGITPPRERSRAEKRERTTEGRRPWSRRIEGDGNRERALRHPTFDLSGDGKTKRTIRSLENRWQEAIKAHDVEALEKLLADDFVATSLTGQAGTKTRLLRELRNDKNVYRSARVQRMTVRAVRPGVAVVTGIATEAGTKENGQRFSSARRFTDTWKQRNDGRWECVSSEVRRLPKR